MRVQALHITGLRHAEELSLGPLGALIRLAKGPAGGAVIDALCLLYGSLDPATSSSVVDGLELGPHELLIEEGRLVQISLEHALGVGPLLHADHRQITVRAELSLDPPLYGLLRQRAVREPRLVTALGQSPSLHLKVGWLFSNDLRAVAVSLLEVRVGDVAFASNERPPWLWEFLRSVGGRMVRLWPPRIEALSLALHEASLAPQPALRRAAERASKALAGPPFRLGRLAFVRSPTGVEPRFGPELLRARQLGPAALEAMALAYTVKLQAPDVLLVEAPGIAQADPAAVVAWLERAIKGEKATLEQVFIAHGGAE